MGTSIMEEDKSFIQKKVVMEDFFSGKLLYGDDFALPQIEKWYKEEAEAFANLYGMSAEPYDFNHSIDNMYGFKYIEFIKQFDQVLGFGSSWGYEFMPIVDKIKNLSIIEASQQTRSKTLGGLVPRYITPTVKGDLDLPDNTFDLITCFSAMHHIPNVTFVMNELFRVLKPGGYFLLREPIHSMGDWRLERIGLTKNERGIPKDYFEKIITNANMKTIRRNYYGFMGSFLERFFHGSSILNSNIYLYIDKCLSDLFSFNSHYHETNKWQRIAPIYVFYVLRKE